MNLHIIVGRLGSDPELQQLPSGTSVVNVSVATDTRVKDRDGNAEKRPTWHRVTLFGQSVESFAQHVKKGRSVAITGEVRRRTGQDQDGNEREYVDTVARTWEFAGSDRSSQQASGGQRRSGNGRRQPRRGSSQRQQTQQADNFDDDIPF